MTNANGPTRVAVLGSTGSIGQSTLDVVRASHGRLQVEALSAHRQTDLLLRQAIEFSPRRIVVTDTAACESQDWSTLPAEVELVTTDDGIRQIVSAPEVDIVVSAIVGSAGLIGTWAALEAGKTVALANKESLVVGGGLVTRLAASTGAKILPVDSEHGAVFQALLAGCREEIRRIILTASGGPFLSYTAEQLDRVTVEEALAHPTWEMGRKITIDSATMINKALEIIEARWLFDLDADQIEVMIHPQSMVHSMVEYIDGSVIAQLSPPDMKLPIQYALMWPQRCDGVAARLDWTKSMHLDFIPPDLNRFDALNLGREVAARGGTAGAVLNGANEAAVAAFLDGRIRFTQIVPAVRAVLEHHDFDPNPTLDRLLQLDRWSRQEVTRWITY